MGTTPYSDRFTEVYVWAWHGGFQEQGVRRDTMQSLLLLADHSGE